MIILIVFLRETYEVWKGDPQVDPRYAGRDYITNPTLERRVVLQEVPELRDQGWAII